ncbi:MAG: thiosulfate oxidation carrier protein SoxY [Rubrivivax sp.]|nr:thiosulfate oxidation carrier protein SoxY [Burkholderiaceae bacterium]MDO9073660.1 thiosulfate oxidation carrier protein SoxY [Rubrivivax sp.]
MKRREFMHKGTGATALGLAAAAGLAPAVASAQAAPAWNKAAFEAKSLADVVKSLGGAGAAAESRDLILQAPEIAENGSVVRVGAQSNIAGTTQIALVIEKNPNALAAVFDVPAGTDANMSTNVKMGQSSNVYALAKVGDKFFYAVKEVKVTLGGCGG